MSERTGVPAVPGSCGWCRDPYCTGDHPGDVVIDLGAFLEASGPQVCWTDGAFRVWTDGAFRVWTDGAFRVWTDGAFRQSHRPAASAVASGEPSRAESPAPVPAEPGALSTDAAETLPVAAALAGAKAKLVTIGALCREPYEVCGTTGADLVSASDILAIIGTEGLRQRPGDQQLPVPNDGPSMHDLAADDVRRRHPGGRAPEIHAVIRDLAARKQLGLDRYASLLQAHNGRDALRDLHEEQLDAIVYCRQWLAENDEEHPYAAVVRLVYRDLLTGALTVRRVMDDAAIPAAGTEAGHA